MDKPAVYRIKVKGVFPEGWIDRLGDLQITDKTSDILTIEGPLAGQSALAGILDTLYTLRLPILEVTLLENY